MKNIFIYLLFLPAVFFAQVGINTNNPDPTAMLDISSTNKGVSVPNVNLLSYTDVTTVPLPKESLIIYNTNAGLLGGTGYYFWNGSRWDYLFSDINTANLQNHLKYYSKVSTTAYNFTNSSSSNQFYGYSNININDLISSEWSELSDVTQTIIVDRTSNDVLFNINGMMQANNSVTSSGVAAYFGIFIDDKLVDIKPLYMPFDQNCNFRTFTIYAKSENLTVGNHVVKFAIRNVSAPSGAITLTYGSKNSSCSTLTNDESRISTTILINQPYIF